MMFCDHVFTNWIWCSTQYLGFHAPHSTFPQSSQSRTSAISLDLPFTATYRTTASVRTQSVTISSLVSHNRYRRSARPEYAAMTTGAAVPVSGHQTTGHRQPDCKARSREPRKIRQVSMRARRCLSVAERPAQSIPFADIWSLPTKIAFWLSPASVVCA